jgi:arylsulfatase A-like enzyme
MKIKLMSMVFGVMCAEELIVRAAECPNFLILLTDDQRWDTIGAYNAECPIKTPNLDRLANAGVRFDNGFVTTPICAVSRASILTGRYQSNADLHFFNVALKREVFDDSYPVHLRRAGYFTGMLGKYGIGVTKHVRESFDVFDAQSDQGPPFREYKGKKMHDAEWLTVKTDEFFDRLPKDRPFALQVNYKEPHFSSRPAPEDVGLLDAYKFKRQPKDTPEAHGKLPKVVQTGFGRVCYDQLYNKNNDINIYLRDYYEKIVSVERSVGQIMENLEKRGLADNTVVIFLSDHGQHFGEMQLAGKWTPYEESLRIPFVVYDPRPGARKGAVLDEMVLNIDVAPTILDLAGIPVPSTMDGKSMAPLLYGNKTPWRDWFAFEHYFSRAGGRYIPRSVGIRTVSEKYIHWTDTPEPTEEFFDLRKDPHENNNLVSNPEYSVRVDALRTKFEQWRMQNPQTYVADLHGSRPESGSRNIDWKRFAADRPEEYQRIKTQVERMDVTWEQAVHDYDIRFEICMKAGYWY